MADDVDILGNININDNGTTKIENFMRSLTMATAKGTLLGNVFTGIGRGILAGFKDAADAVIGFGESSVQQAMKMQDATAQLDATYKSTAAAFNQPGTFTTYTQQLSAATAQLDAMEKAAKKSADSVTQLVTTTNAHTGKVSEHTKVIKVDNATTAAAIEAQKAHIAELQKDIQVYGESAGVWTKQATAIQFTRDAALKLADAMTSTTRYTKEQVIAGESVMLTFTKIGQNVFPDAMHAAADLATKMHVDLQQAIVQVGKALQDPQTGMMNLRREGVNFTKEQQKMLEGMVAAGHLEEAQKYILKELQTEFGGSAEAAGKTFAGQLDILNNRLDLLKEHLGEKIIPYLQQFTGYMLDKGVPALGKASDAFDKLLSGDTKGAFLDLAEGVHTAFGEDGLKTFFQFKDSIMGILELPGRIKTTFDTVKTSFNMFGAGDPLGGIGNVLYALKQDKLGDIFNSLSLGLKGLSTAGTDIQKSGLTESFNQIGKAAHNLSVEFNASLPKVRKFATDAVGFVQNMTTQLAAYLGPTVANILNTMTDIWHNHGQQILTIIGAAWKLIVATVGGAITLVTGIINIGLTFIQGIMNAASDALKGDWGKAWQDLVDTNKKLMEELKTMLKAFFNEALSIAHTNLTNFMATWKTDWNMGVEIVTKVFENIKKIISDQISQWFDLGKQLVQGIWNGISANFGQMMHDLQFKFQQVTDLAKGIFGVQSPSTVFHDIGKNIVEGLTKGTRDRFAIESPSKIFAGIGQNLMTGFTSGILGTAYLPMNALNNIADAMTLKTARTVNNASTTNTSFNFYMNGDPAQPPSWLNHSGMNQLSNLARSV